MQTSSAIRPYTFGEEVCNCAIHGLGIIFSVAGLAVLVSLSSKYGDLWTVASTAVFGVSMILLYTASTLYHAVPYPRVKKVLPHRHLLSDRRQLHALFAGQHARAGRLVGFCRHLEPGAHRHGFENRHFRQRHQTVVDFALSDHGLGNHFRFRQLFAAISAVSALFLVLGGLFYTFGVFFYVWKSKKYTHAVWHLMVLAGTVMHFFAVLYACVLV